MQSGDVIYKGAFKDAPALLFAACSLSVDNVEVPFFLVLLLRLALDHDNELECFQQHVE
jgi:hypothetical protein